MFVYIDLHDIMIFYYVPVEFFIEVMYSYYRSKEFNNPDNYWGVSK
jgi:hypothetical protein